MPTAQPLRTGDPQRLGEYALSGRLGEGGQGAVFLGSRSGQTYAVKLLHGPVGDERAAFLREVELAKHVARFCTAQVVDAGFDEGRPYIVSEYVDGPSLQREVALTGPRRGGALERLAVGTATALTAIHRAGIVHRDFKPQNVLLGSDGPRVIDFGLAKALDAAATVSGRGVGTPAYMAPEQITASLVTGAADVFSWGATMCFAANATAPFGQDSVAPVLHRILTAPPELGLLEGRLRTLVDACLDKDARNRPTSRELLFELLGESDAVPPEVLSSPPAHILRVTPPLVPEPRPSMSEPRPSTPEARSPMPSLRPSTPEARSPMPGLRPSAPEYGPSTSEARSPLAEPEATGASGGYRLPGFLPGTPSVPGTEAGVPEGEPRGAWLRAVLAVCAALLVTVTVLVTILISNKDGGGGEIPQAARPPGPTQSPSQSDPASSPPPTSTSAPIRQGEGKPTAGPPVARPVTVGVPMLTGLDREAATKAIRRAGLVPGTVAKLDSPRKIGQVLGTSPASGTVVNRGSTVSLQVSAGLPVPSVVGQQRKAAEAALTGAGLAVGAVTRSCSPQPDGQVLSTSPQAGRRVPGGTAVGLTVSRQGATVPSVVGRSRADGRAAVIAAGFTVRTIGQVVEDESKVGTILSQSLPPGCAATGAAVTLVVGTPGQPGPDPDEPTETPTASIPGE
ncbi:PASTA domain-containing protein [Nonomuraea sp. NPDC046802]|uniref:protein kinase domain-containing protein n=1 Tax=Nonomuraea sp. NPDC046802 TaxID=3154919 RepID=UPI0033E9DE6E